MKITIEISVEEARALLTQEEPSIEEDPGIHEDFLEEPEPDPKPVRRSPQAKAAAERKERKRGMKAKAYEVRVDGEWKRFQSANDAAKFIGCPRQRVYDAVSKCQKCNGYDVRHSTEENEEETLPR